MADFILLKNPKLCPRCFARRAARHSGRCGNCGAMLFNHFNHDFAAYDLTGPTRIWWAFCPQRGWVSRDYVLQPGTEALRAFVPEEILPADYGQKTATARAREAMLAAQSP